MHKTKLTKNSNNKKKYNLKEFGLFLFDIFYNAVIIIILVVIIRTFLVSPFRVLGSSMVDTLYNKEFILIDKLSYHIGEPERGDTIVFLPPITNDHLYKFETEVMSDEKGAGVLNIDNIRTVKSIAYCQNSLLQKIWLCKEKIKEKDIVYYLPLDSNKTISSSDLDWQKANKKIITKDDVKDEKIVINGEKKTKYIIRIYNSTGPEYFVKRIIGIPGDTIIFENKRVYLKTQDGNKFELNEPYLNKENKNNTKPDIKNEFTVPEGQYFVLGDNRNHSSDSRRWVTPIDKQPASYVDIDNISGKVLIVLWPLNKMRFISSGVSQ